MTKVKCIKCKKKAIVVQPILELKLGIPLKEWNCPTCNHKNGVK